MLLSACSAFSAVKASVLQGEEVCATACSGFQFRFAQDECQRAFTTKSTKDTKNGIRSKLQHPQPEEYKYVCLVCGCRESRQGS